MITAIILTVCAVYALLGIGYIAIPDEALNRVTEAFREKESIRSET